VHVAGLTPQDAEEHEQNVLRVWEGRGEVVAAGARLDGDRVHAKGGGEQPLRVLVPDGDVDPDEPVALLEQPRYVGGQARPGALTRYVPGVHAGYTMP
jgi:hypothetical protein